MKRPALFIISVSVLVIVSAYVTIIRADEPPFANNKEQIINALKGKDGQHVIEGEIYIVEKETVYKMVNGMKVKLRGLGGVAQREVSPRVALAILFEYDKDVVSPASQPLVRELGTALSSETLRGSKLVICGHTDADGSDSYNMTLSRKRAERIKQILVSEYGIPESTLTVEAYGKTKPIASNATEEGKAKNRRVEIVRLIEQ